MRIARLRLITVVGRSGFDFLRRTIVIASPIRLVTAGFRSRVGIGASIRARFGPILTGWGCFIATSVRIGFVIRSGVTGGFITFVRTGVGFGIGSRVGFCVAGFLGDGVITRAARCRIIASPAIGFWLGGFPTATGRRLITRFAIGRITAGRISFARHRIIRRV